MNDAEFCKVKLPVKFTFALVPVKVRRALSNMTFPYGPPVGIETDVILSADEDPPYLIVLVVFKVPRAGRVAF